MGFSYPEAVGDGESIIAGDEADEDQWCKPDPL